MRKVIILGLVFILVILSLFGCSNKIDLVDEELVVESNDLLVHYNEDDLLAKLKESSDLQFYSYLCEDFDGDGCLELFAINNDDNFAKVWFVSSDLNKCFQVYKSSNQLDNASGEVIDNQGFKHFVLNEHNSVGDIGFYHLFAVNNDKVDIIYDGSGYLYPLDEDSIALDGIFYDAMYDASIQSLIGLTKKTTYLVYDNNEYKEYGASEIDEVTFNELVESDEIMKAVEAQCSKYEGEVSYQYFKRNNGYYHVQYNIKQDNGAIIYGYVTLDDHHHLSYNDGKVIESFSGLKNI